jgi:predicted lipoprotein
MNDTQVKIAELTAIKDKLEQAFALMGPAGFTPYSYIYKSIANSIDSLRFSITGLQTGSLPFVTLNEENRNG